MIEWCTGPNGRKVIRCDGRLLASRYDPEGEARAWLERRLPFLDKVATVFVLGAGSGYHIDEVARRTKAAIVVIEACQDLLEAVRPIVTVDSSRLKWVLAGSVKDLRASEDVRRGLSGSFLALEHPASVSLNADLFREYARILRGRDWGSLSWQWNLKGFAPLDDKPRIESGGEALTIYDLAQCELVTDSKERERLLILALRELVK